MKKNTAIQQDFLDTDTLENSEITHCDFFQGDDATLKIEKIGLPKLDLIAEAIMIADSQFNLESIYDRTRYIARWGKIGAQIMILLKKTTNEWHFENESQPRIVNEKRNLQIIFMSGNHSVGNVKAVLSASCPKGFMTLKNIDINQYKYDETTKMRTWILYFPTRSHIAYKGDLPKIPYELAYPTGYTQSYSKSKIKILPKNHSCRILGEIDNNLPTGKNPKTEFKPSNEITADDFGIQLTG